MLYALPILAYNIDGTDISEFIKNAELKMKVVVVDKRLTCNHRVEWQYYHAHKTIGNENNPIGICSFCACELQTSETEELKEHIKDLSRVSPSCGKTHCLRLNPKANFKDGWTVKKKQSHKRKVSANKPSSQAKKRKKSKPKPKKPKPKPKKTKPKPKKPKPKPKKPKPK